MPCTISDRIVMKNTTLKISRAFGTSATSGYVAKIIGTAPRRPTHEMYILPRFE